MFNVKRMRELGRRHAKSIHLSAALLVGISVVSYLNFDAGSAERVVASACAFIGLMIMPIAFLASEQ